MIDLDDALADALLRYRLAIERVGLTTARAMASDIEAAITTVQTRIETTGGTYRLEEVRRELVAALTELRAKLDGRIGETISGILDTAPQAVRAALSDLRSALDAGEVSAAPGAREWITAALSHRVPIERLAQIGAVPFDGKSWRAWGAQLATDMGERIESEARQWFATGEGIPDLRRRIAKATGLSKTSADRLARTLAADVSAQATRVSLDEMFGDSIVGWRWVSTLDGRTSPQCRALDGKEWRRGEAHPRPPLHPCCRSILVTITKLSAQLNEGAERPWNRATDTPAAHARDLRRTAKERIGEYRWGAMTEVQRRQEVARERDSWNARNSGTVSAGTTYAEWLKRQPERFQREVLGKTRFDLFQSGVPLASMVSPDHMRPLTVAELRTRFPA